MSHIEILEHCPHIYEDDSHRPLNSQLVAGYYDNDHDHEHCHYHQDNHNDNHIHYHYQDHDHQDTWWSQ